MIEYTRTKMPAKRKDTYDSEHFETTVIDGRRVILNGITFRVARGELRFPIEDCDEIMELLQMIKRMNA